MKEFCFSGTLGDAFIVFCKLHNYCRITNDKVRLRRYSKHIDFDDMINELFYLDPNIHYQMPCIQSLNPFVDIKGEKAEYINICWDGQAYNQIPPDPENIKIDPYPEIDMARIYDNSISSKREEQAHPKINLKVGIQLHSGKGKSNFKGFSLKWIRKIRKALPKEYNFIIFGTGEGYLSSEIDQLCSLGGIESLVGRIPFNEWLYNLTLVDFLITPEGFASFFSMSQRIPTLTFYSSPESLCRVHPKWRRNNTLVDLGSSNIVQRIINKLQARSNTYSFYEPIKPEFIRPIIEHDVLAVR